MNSPLLTLSSAILASALMLGASAQAASQQQTREELANNPPLFLQAERKTLNWDEPTEPAKIVGPVYSVGTKGLGVFLIKTTEGLILINTGMPGSGPMTAAAIRKLGFKPKDVKLVLIGHAHVDHAGAAAYFKKLSGARIAAIREEKDLVESGGKTDFQYGKYKDFWFDPVMVDWVFEDGDTLTLGDVAIKAFLTSGHTPGSTTFLTSVMDSGRRYSVLFPNGLGINPGYRVAKDPSYIGIGNNYERTLHILGRLQPDIWLDSHTDTYNYDGKLARSKTDGVNAWIDPEGYKRWVSEQHATFEAEVNAELGLTQK